MRSQNPGQVMILVFYSWTAFGDDAGSCVALGITDDRGHAMRAGEESLTSGRARWVIIEVVRPAMAPHTLAPCYERTGVGWLGRRAGAGEVTWHRYFPGGGLDGLPEPGKIEA
jgi:hypothetical protein